MALSRREFVRRFGAGGAAVASAAHIIGYGREELLAFTGEAQGQRPTGPVAIRLSSNENMRGPSPKVLEILRSHPSKDLGLGYPPPNLAAFKEAIATFSGAKAENVIMSTGSGEILTAAVMAYCSPDRALVTADPSYSSPNGTARNIKAPVKLTPVDARLRLDLEALIRGAIGAGLVFLCNPNNPTSSVHTMADIESAVRTIKTRSPETGILIDEAYLEYATLPGSGTMAKLALELPGVFISRTFSKAYGLAGMRMGYAIGQPATMDKVGRAWGLGSLNELQAIAGITALKETVHMEWEKGENKRVRDWTQGQFKEMGYSSPDSQTNFIFVNIRKPAVQFRDACRAQGVAVGRDFPPMEKTYARISLGTMENMQQAMVVFKKVLGA
ncbi:MAG: histidinol-phosphate aminotransferase family protein [Acidobacteria bacterium]|nr:histidinol-phosphate aminotransferase family protein [Acidobacteriota bacterium]MSO61647.1 histidinol-phosphate aminotransferase family protein [Acidobacteriota bacterium]